MRVRARLLSTHWSITSIVNRPFNSRVLLTARRAVNVPFTSVLPAGNVAALLPAVNPRW